MRPTWLELASQCGAKIHPHPCQEGSKCQANLHYIFGTLFMDFEKRLKIFGKGTQRINESTYEDKENEVLGSCVTLVGDPPSNLHFFATDTKKHFISGSLLFSAAPNYDSLAPAIGYIRNDVQKMLETLRWQ